MTLMRIGLYLYSSRGGSGRYLWELAQALLRIAPKNEYFFYYDQQRTWWPRIRHARVHSRMFRYPLDRYEWAMQMALPMRLRRDRIDIFHSQAFQLPIQVPCPSVVAVHDAIPFTTPDRSLPPWRRRVVPQKLRIAVQIADHILVPSQHTRQALLRHVPFSAGKTTCVPLGCSPSFSPLLQSRAQQIVRRRFRVKRPYFLSVGLLIPRKNYPCLIRAFRRRLRATTDLVIVGAPWWSGEEVFRLIRGDSTIHHLEGVSDEMLRVLYAGAEGLAYPSEDEGFGLPPLEAMSCGTPVIVARAASLPEVVGKAALFVKPGSVGELAQALEAVRFDAPLRAKLRLRGLARVRRFTWDETASRTLQVYENVLRRKRRFGA